jgi:Cu(I)/Ag(I) efflux system membrane fusion protein
MKTKYLAAILLILLLASVGLNVRQAVQLHETDVSSAAQSAKRLWTCPMHPSIVQDHPGDCPICGMKLVPMESTPNNPESIDVGDVEGRATVTIDPTRQQLIGLRTAPVTRGQINSEWTTVGRIEVDPTRVSKINVKTPGYVEHVFVDFVGKPVRRGEPLFIYYSPELLTAQREYLLALQARIPSPGGASQSDSLLISAARQKLRLWDVPQAQIEKLEQTGEAMRALTFVSPVTGVVTAKNVVEGSSLNPGDTPYEVTDLSSVWVMADAYQSDAVRAKVGMPAAIHIESLPGQVFRGVVAFVDPVLDPQSRTFKVRINVDNASGELKPQMFTEVQFEGTPHEALTIPVDAVIPSGRGNMVFLAIGDGRFRPRSVRLGEKTGDRIEVLEGLNEGESVVSRANFLVDSESSLRAALAAVGGER